MRSVQESFNIIRDEYLRQARFEVREGGISTNRPWITAQRGRVKRGPSAFLPTDGSQPETTAAISRRQLSHVADIMLARSRFMEDATHFEEQGRPVPKASPEYKARQVSVLKERDIPPIELAFLFGYTSDRGVRDLRARHGLDENSGRPLRDEQRPLATPIKKRQRKVRGKR